jgi:hypothetical protein
VITTCWKTPATGSETTTNAGELVTLPVAQAGSQSFRLNVPLPEPEVVPHADHVTFVRETARLAQPM